MELVESFCKQAWSAIRAARLHYDGGDYPSCVKEAQHAVELMLKALLKRYIGDFPKKHDVGDEVYRSAEKLPEGLRPHLARLWMASKVLGSWREPSTYGIEAEQTPPHRLFTKAEAELALQYAEEVRSILRSYTDLPLW